MRLITPAVVLAVGLLLAPLAAAAQQAPKIAKVGVLISSSSTTAADNLAAFRKGLQAHGHIEGETFVLVPRYGDARAEELPRLARELVSLKPDVIVVSTDPTVAAVKRETRTIPIVMIGGTDPVGTGFVASFARPGGNVTGLTNSSSDLSGKRLELLMEAVPRLSRVAFLWNPDVRGAILAYKETESAARLLHLPLQSVEVTSVEDLERAFTVITEQRAQGLIVQGPNPVAFVNQGQIVRFAQRNRLPSIFATRAYVDAGGLMSYGVSLRHNYGRAAYFVDRILKGSKPADLPVEQPTKFELVINLKTAKALGLTIPPSVLGRADQVIQ